MFDHTLLFIWENVDWLTNNLSFTFQYFFFCKSFSITYNNATFYLSISIPDFEFFSRNTIIPFRAIYSFCYYVDNISWNFGHKCECLWENLNKNYQSGWIFQWFPVNKLVRFNPLFINRWISCSFFSFTRYNPCGLGYEITRVNGVFSIGCQ